MVSALREKNKKNNTISLVRRELWQQQDSQSHQSNPIPIKHHSTWWRSPIWRYTGNRYHHHLVAFHNGSLDTCHHLHRRRYLHFLMCHRLMKEKKWINKYTLLWEILKKSNLSSIIMYKFCTNWQPKILQQSLKFCDINQPFYIYKINSCLILMICMYKKNNQCSLRISNISSFLINLILDIFWIKKKASLNYHNRIWNYHKGYETTIKGYEITRKGYGRKILRVANNLSNFHVLNLSYRRSLDFLNVFSERIIS